MPIGAHVGNGWPVIGGDAPVEARENFPNGSRRLAIRRVVVSEALGQCEVHYRPYPDQGTLATGALSPRGRIGYRQMFFALYYLI